MGERIDIDALGDELAGIMSDAIAAIFEAIDDIEGLSDDEIAAIVTETVGALVKSANVRLDRVAYIDVRDLQWDSRLI